MKESVTHSVARPSPDDHKMGNLKATSPKLDGAAAKGFQNGHANLFNVSKSDKMNAIKRRMTQGD